MNWRSFSISSSATGPREEFSDGGDVVTALWQANFYRVAHIKYATDDLFWQDEPILDIAGLKVFDPDQSTPANETPEQRDAQSLASPEHSEDPVGAHGKRKRR